jgi:hypothetical protein
MHAPLSRWRFLNECHDTRLMQLQATRTYLARTYMTKCIYVRVLMMCFLVAEVKTTNQRRCKDRPGSDGKQVVDSAHIAIQTT